MGDHVAWLAAVVLGLAALSARARADPTTYQIGVGRADVTGPAAEIVFNGYANFAQAGAGIHTRLYSRAFIVGDDQHRVVFVSVDIGMISQLVRMQVIKSLHESYGELYTDSNVCLSSTHTHSGPGGFFQYLLYNIPIKGFVKQSMDAVVQGIVKSIKLAHDSVRPGHVTYKVGNLEDANINRSPLSYLQNPYAERALYDADTDHQMVLLKFTDESTGEAIGMVNWFAVHCTSVNNTNLLVSSDNKGIAALLFEQRMDPGSLPGRSKFVGAFAQANEGDVSPNTRGAMCQDTGEPCDAATSTCGGSSKMCYALGPGKDMFESARIIGEKQYEKAWELFQTADIPISGPVKSIHQYINMASAPVVLNDTTTVTTCSAALGHSFAAGTTDGPGMFDFKQHTQAGQENTLWNIIRNLIKPPSKEIVECHKPKPVLFATGEMAMPFAWTPAIISTQLLQLGNFIIAAAPGEFTTMSGRRLRNVVKKAFEKGEHSGDIQVAIAGLSNTYTNYVATFEEYQFQRYEGASTLFGPRTLDAYLQQFGRLADALVKDETLDAGPSPPDLLKEQISLVTPVLIDTAPMLKRFGDVVLDPLASYSKGQIVEVTFISGNPRNNPMLDGTFLTVERKDDASSGWIVVATDADWETKFMWRQTNTLLGQSEATVQWQVPQDAKSGEYRIRHLGYRKNLLSGIKPYQGLSKTFMVQ